MDGFVHGKHEDFTVADCALIARAAQLLEATDRAFHEIVIDGDFQFDFSQEIRGIFVAAIGFGLATLAGETGRIANGQARDTNPSQRLLHELEFGGLDDCDDEFHVTEKFPRQGIFQHTEDRSGSLGLW